MVKPIPLRLLFHSATLETLQAGRWQDGEPLLKSTLQRVRIDPTSKITIGKDGTELQLSAVLFVDAVNSIMEPAATFELGDLITSAGHSWTIQTIEPINQFDKLHHWEIGLV